MFMISILTIWLCLLIIVHQAIQHSELSYNQPELPPDACWNSQALVFANQSTLGFYPDTLFVDRNGAVYIISQYSKNVRVWRDGVSMTIINTLLQPISLFVTTDGSIFFASADGTVEKWTPNATNSSIIMKFDQSCDGLFIDHDNSLYCSSKYHQRVLKQSLDVTGIVPTIVAGIGVPGWAPDQLFFPEGIFVDSNLDLYVADCMNNRVQLFHNGEHNGTTIAGNGDLVTIKLRCPTAVFLDADKHLFIVDHDNSRIIRKSSDGFDCVAGCSGIAALASDRLYRPSSAAFDPFGNIFVVDSGRVQTFLLSGKDSDNTTRIQSTYSVEWTMKSLKYSPTGCDMLDWMFEAIQINVEKSGCYTFDKTANSTTYGYMYRDSFDPAYPETNLISKDDGTSQLDQFKMRLYLQSNVTYVLVVSKENSSTTVSFSILANGFSSISLKHLNIPRVVQTIYSSLLTRTSSMYTPNGCGVSGHYFQAIQINVNRTGSYTFYSMSELVTYAYVYEDNFDPNNPAINQFLSQYAGCKSSQFKFTTSLQADRDYILVLTTYYSNVTGPFSIVVSGETDVLLKYIDLPSAVQSSYSSQLGTNSSSFVRPGFRELICYYEAIQVNVNQTGSYILSSESHFDAYGYLYRDTFDPNNPSINLLAENDSGCRDEQVKLLGLLQSNTSYVLVVTTYHPNVTGLFSIFASHRSNVLLKRINVETTSTTLRTSTTSTRPRNSTTSSPNTATTVRLNFIYLTVWSMLLVFLMTEKM